LAHLAAESAANYLASFTSGMSGAPRALRALRLVVVACCIGAARSSLAAPRALAFGSLAAAPRPGASTLPPRSRRRGSRPGDRRSPAPRHQAGSSRSS
jgi:hypothetical protein